MPFCPNCAAEYKEGFTRCEECSLDLVDKLSPENMVHDLSAAPMVELRSFGNSTEGEMAQEVLHQNGLRSQLQGDVTGGTLFPTPITAVKLLVDERDFDRAKELVDAYFEAEMEDNEPAETEENAPAEIAEAADEQS